MNGDERVRLTKSIGFTVGIVISLVLLVILGLKAGFDIKNSYDLTVKNNEQIKQEETRKFASRLETKFASAYQTGQVAQKFLEQYMETTPINDRNRTFISEAVIPIYQNSEVVIGIGVYFEPNAFDGRDTDASGKPDKGRFAFYATGEGSDFSINDDFETSGYEWYERPLKEQKVLLLDPYMDPDAGGIVTSYCFPIMYQSRAIGVIIVDIEVNGIQDVLAKQFPTSDDFKVLMSARGTVVANSFDESTIMMNLLEITPFLRPFFDAAQDNQESLTSFVSPTSGKDSYVVFVPVDTPGTEENWVFESITSFDHFTVEAKKDALVGGVISFLTILVVGAVVFAVLIRRVVRPVRVMVSAIGKMSNYNLDLSDEKERAKRYRKDKSEIGVVLRAVGVLDDNLKDIIANITSHAQNTAATAEQLTATAQSTSDSAGEVSSAVGNIAEGATSQAEDTQSAASSVEASNQLLKGMFEILMDLVKATDMIHQSKNEGNESLQELVHAVEISSRSAEEINSTIAQTRESAEKISVAGDMIQAVSDQTNLLALNAAIEAARAGDAGRGFAVVAEEIRKLAEQSAGFTDQIKSTIEDLKIKVERAVHSMKEVSEVVVNQNIKLKETEGKFDNISEAVDTAREIVKKLNQSSRDIEEKNQEMVSVIESLSAISEENAATTQEASAAVDTQVQSISDITKASENLAEIATDLQNEVAKFQM